MKKKTLKTGAFILATCLSLGTAYFANALVGNPVSRLKAEHNAKEYIAKTYPGENFVAEEARYSFKEGGYNVKVADPKSMDKHFHLTYDFFGNLGYDSYEYYVVEKANTVHRVWKDYKDLTDSIIDGAGFPLQMDFGYGELMTGSGESVYDMPLDMPNRMANEDFELDKIYDVRLLGKDMGKLVIYAESDDLTPEELASSLLKVKEAFDNSGVPFFAIDMELRHPKNEDGEREEGFIGFDNFLYSDISDDGKLLEKVKTQIRLTREHYEMLDNMNMKDE